MINEEVTNKFLEIVEENRKLIYKVCHMYCDSQIDKNDLFQEIVANLWKAYPQFKGQAKISTWIYKISFNTAISWLRNNSCDKNYIQYTDVIPEMTRDTEYEQINETLHNALDCLGKIDRAIILLQLDGYSYDDISEIVGLTKTNIATKINRIKLKLKNHLLNN